MSDILRIALLLDPLTVRTRGGDHAPSLARELRALGHTVELFGSRPGAPHANGAPERHLSPAGLRAFAPQVLLAYDPLSPTSYAGARVARRLRAGLVLIEPGWEAEALRLSRRMLHGIGERLWGSYVRSTARAVVALDPLAEELAHAKGFARERVSVLPEGLDTQAFRPGLTSPLVARHRIRGRLLLYTGPIELARDLETLVAAFANSVGGRLDWSLVLAGEGHAKGALRAQAERLGVSDRVVFLPRPGLEDMPGLMGASTLLAQPGRGAEVHGRQVARALACGLPVVAAELPRLRHLVRPERTGLWAEPGSLASWTEMLRRAAGSPGVRERWSREARALAERELAWPVIGRGFERVLREVSARRDAA